MRNYLLVGFLLIASQLLILNSGPLAQNPEPSPGGKSTPGQCAGKASDCKEPVQFLSKEGECVCFSCEYGTRSQKTVCTTSKDEEKLLVDKERDSAHRYPDRARQDQPPQH
jgi:hypothetical protein